VALLEVSRVATVTLDPEAKVTSWNPAAEELFGYSSEEAVGRKLAELVAATPELQAEAIRLTERAAREGRTQAVTRGTHKDGTVVDVEVVAASVVSDGEHLGHIAIYRDVSEHRRAEEERRRAENRYLDLIERLPLTVYIDRLDDVSSNVYTSPHLESVLGYTAEEWTSDDELFLKVVHPDDRERVLAEHVRTRETGEQFKTEYRMIAKDGTVRWFLDQARVVADDRTGLPAYHQGFLLEITERKELEEALKRSEAELRRQKQYFESLLEISPTAVVTVDLQDKVSSWNPAAERLFGYSKAEAIGRSIDELVADSDEVRAEAVAHSDQARVGRVQAVTRRTRKDGALVDVELLAVPLTLDGELAGSYAIYHDIGALKQAAEAQREAEKRYRDLIEHVPLVTYIDEPSETAPNIYTSPQVEALVGTPPDEWVGDPDFFPKLLHPDDRERVIADHGRALSSGASSWSFEYRLLARDGRTVWIRDDAVVVKDERGQPLYTQGFMLDITERKHAEEALRRSEVEVRRQKQYYQTLLEISPAAVVTMDLEERVTSWNPAAERLFGYTQDEAVGELIDELVLRREDLVEEGVAVSREAAEQGAAHLIARRMRKDGTLVDVEVLMAPLVVGGEQVGWNVIYHDISELQRQKQFLESLLDISPVATVTIDLEDKISSWNPAAQRLFGYSKAEAIGANIDDLIAGPEELQAEAAGYAEAARRGPLRAITRRSRKDGTLVDVVLLATPVIVEDETIGHLAVYHDISELQRAREEAEAATHAKSVFLATMSHEIRTPMNAVIGMTDLLLETELDQEQRDFVEVVRTSGDVLLRVIDDVLDFSKIESGKLELERRPFELRECVESALELVATQAAERDLELGCLIDSDVPPEITGDAARLRQVLLNLVGNAVKFTEEGEVVVVVRREGSAPGGHRLHVAVRDTGIGIPEERMSELFQSFSQVDASTSRRFGGTGLGLAISKRLSELMGGTMWAESAPGQGSTFHFTFVAAEAPVTAPPHAGGRPAAAPRQAATGGGRQRHQPGDRGAPGAVLGNAPAGNRTAQRGAHVGRAGRPLRCGDPRHADARDRWSGARPPHPWAARRTGPAARAAHLVGPQGAELGARVRGHPDEAGQGFAALRRARGHPGPASRGAQGAGGAGEGRARCCGRPRPLRPADPGGGGQRGEPEARPGAAREARLRGRRGGERSRGSRGGGGRELRRRADGRPDARARRARGDPAHSPTAPPRPAAHHRHDRERAAGGPRGLLRCRHGRLPRQATPGGSAGGRSY
jgi:PAS domain S-box-containing protein